MSNLVVTIISILLIAIVAIVGIFYGGPAYENAQARAGANALIAQAQQMATAWQAWSNDNAGNQNPGTSAVTTYCNGTIPNFLMPNYLSTYPVITSFGVPWAGYPSKWFFADWHSNSYGANCMPLDSNPNALRITLAYSPTTYNICLYYNQILQGSTEPANPVSTAVTITPPGVCAYADVNSNGVADAGDYITFIYTVF